MRRCRSPRRCRKRGSHRCATNATTPKLASATDDGSGVFTICLSTAEKISNPLEAISRGSRLVCAMVFIENSGLWSPVPANGIVISTCALSNGIWNVRVSACRWSKNCHTENVSSRAC